MEGLKFLWLPGHVEAKSSQRGGEVRRFSSARDSARRACKPKAWCSLPAGCRGTTGATTGERVEVAKGKLGRVIREAAWRLVARGVGLEQRQAVPPQHELPTEVAFIWLQEDPSLLLRKSSL